MISKPPYPLPGIVVSHIGIHETCERGQRNLQTRHIKKITEHKGLIGIGLWKGATCGTDVENTVVAIEYVKNLLGHVDSIAMGSDFDGAVKTHFDGTGMPRFNSRPCCRRGFTKQEIRQIMGENLRDFLFKPSSMNLGPPLPLRQTFGSSHPRGDMMKVDG